MANGQGGAPRGQTVTAALAARGQAPDQPGAEVAVRAPSPLEKWLRGLDIERQLVQHIPAEYFLRTALTGLRNSPQLTQIARTDTGRASIAVALLESARAGLMPFTDEAAIVPFGKTAAFVPEYKGLIKQFFNSGLVQAVEARMIHQRDQWSLTYGSNGGFYHEPALVDAEGNAVDRGAPVLAYCYLRLKDGGMTAVTTVTRSEAEYVMRNHSRRWQQAETNGKKNSPWHTEFPAMWLKTAIRQHATFAPKSAELAMLLLAAARDDTHQNGASAPPRPADMGVQPGDGEVFDAEVVDDPDATAPAAQDATGFDEVPLPPDPRGDPEPPRQPDGDPEPPPRNRTMAAVQALYRECGLGGQRYDKARRYAAAMLARTDDDQPPVELGSMTDLTDAQLARVRVRLAALQSDTDGPAAAKAVLIGLAEQAGARPTDGTDDDGHRAP